MSLRSTLERHWYQRKLTWLTILLKPFSLLFFIVIWIRRKFYQFGILKTVSFTQPVIVVGNITVGGTGKTPFIIKLVEILREQGFHPGMISRGVGGKKNRQPIVVTENSSPAEVGDESVLLFRRTHCPLVISIDRARAAQILLEKNNCNIVIADDGLQHYRLGRQYEIAIVDAARQFGNGCLLPAGPLREPISRLQKTDLVIYNGTDMQLIADQCVSLTEQQKKCSLEFFSGKKVHAIAAIGNPERFFSSLIAHGIDIIPHIFPDHYLFRSADIFFSDHYPVLMTEKDAVKCENFADERHWYVPVTVELDIAVKNRVLRFFS